jgi:hypothetical protein
MTVLQFKPQTDCAADRLADHPGAAILVFPYERIPHFLDRTARQVASHATCDDRNQAMIAVITDIYEKLSGRGVDDRLKEKACIDFSKVVWAVVARIDRREDAL